MQKEMKELSELRYSMSMNSFKDSWEQEDYEWDRAANKRCDELIKKVKGGYVIKEGNYYMTEDTILCWSESPTYFESEEEAKEQWIKICDHNGWGEDKRAIKPVYEENKLYEEHIN